MNTDFKKPETPLVIYTDLDGTLLDHDSYRFQAALPALQRLQALNVPVIPVSSKTLAELQGLMQQLGLGGPCIAENGALIAYPRGYFPDVEDLQSIGGYQVERRSPDYPVIVETLQQLRTRYGFRFEGFFEMSVRQVSENTGLNAAEAELAKKRLGSEPLRWLDTDQAFEQFSSELLRRHYHLLQGGRFWHVLGQTDKAAAIHKINERFEAAGYSGYTSVALGDSPNDIPMLRAADVAVVIRRKDGTHMAFEDGTEVFRTQGIGPEGWNEFVQAYLDKLSQGTTAKRTGHG